MNSNTIQILRGVVFTLFICLFVASSSHGGGYEALDGINDIKVVFDVRAKKAKSAAIQLDLIHQTFKDQNIRKITDKPDFVVVIAGSAVKLVSSDTEGFSEEKRVLVSQIAKTVSAMAKDGIKLEICLFAANLYGIDPGTILPEITHVDNGWISLIGYQTKGYTLVAAF